MLVRRTIKPNQSDLFPVRGRYFSIISGTSLRVSLLKNGSRIMSTDMYAGMGTKEDAIDAVELVSSVAQTVEYWVGEADYSYTPPSARAAGFNITNVAVGIGIKNIIPFNERRMTASFVAPRDLWIGGDSLTIVDNKAQNAEFVPKGDKFTMTSQGAVNCWLTDNPELELDSTNRPYDVYSKPTTKEQAKQLFDSSTARSIVQLPDNYDNVPFSLVVKWRGGVSPTPSNYVTYGFHVVFVEVVDGVATDNFMVAQVAAGTIRSSFSLSHLWGSGGTITKVVNNKSLSAGEYAVFVIRGGSIGGTHESISAQFPSELITLADIAIREETL